MMSPSLSRHLRESAFPLLIVFGVAGLFLLVLATGSVRALASALFVVLGVVVAFGSGNPRLFALWGLMITISLNLSKHFGPIVNKGGGETSFRAEVSASTYIARRAASSPELISWLVKPPTRGIPTRSRSLVAADATEFAVHRESVAAKAPRSRG